MSIEMKQPKSDAPSRAMERDAPPSAGFARWLALVLIAVLALTLGAGAPWAAADDHDDDDEDEVVLEEARIYWEYNSSGNDLGVHVFLDGEDWKSMKIKNPKGKTIFQVKGKRGYAELGLTELFFEGAEPSLDEFALDELLELFPAGEYEFEGKTIDGAEIEGEATLSHAIPNGPEVWTDGVSGSTLVIEWDVVDSAPAGFPDEPIEIVGYQVIVESFQVTLPSWATSCTVPPEYVDSLEEGEEYEFEVLAIDVSGNQSITEGTFTK